MDEGYEVYCGLDVGKSEHHAAALNALGERVFDKPLPQDDARLRELFIGLQQHGRGAGHRGSAQHNRRAANSGGAGLRLHCCLPAGPGDAQSR